MVPDNLHHVFPFCFYLSENYDRFRQRLHYLRDMYCALFLTHALRDRGFRFEELLLNYPPLLLADGSVPAIRPVDVSFLHSGDLILQMTRPPLGDVKPRRRRKTASNARRRGNRKVVPRGYTDLEEALFKIWRRCIQDCKRLEVMLSQPLCQDLEPDLEHLGRMAFFEMSCAPFNEPDGPRLRRHKGHPKGARTALFLLRTDEIWPGGPGLLGAFGMDGITSLIWAYRLLHDKRELLDERGFLVAEMQIGAIPELPHTLEFTRDWPIEVVLQRELDLTPAA